MGPARQTQTFQFINQANPTDRVSQEARRKARSHAARSGHARLRRLRTLQYQAEQAELELVVAAAPPAGPHDNIIGGYFPYEECDESRQTSSGRSSPERRMVYVPRPTATTVPVPDMRDPFLSYKYAFTPLEDYLFQHFMSIVIPYINSFCYRMGRFHSDLLSVTSDWVKIGLTDAAFKNTIYLAACRHLWKTQHKEDFHEMSMRFKIACMRELNHEIAKAVPINSTVVAKTIMLSWDELALGDTKAASAHMKGALKMLELRPKPEEDVSYIETFLSEALYAINARPRPGHLPEPEPELKKIHKTRPDPPTKATSSTFAVA
ncbi:hypothetical protein GE09DRAFT_1209785 [Coniochaeta sp. 2T2.1]|nr:hypothetical protein GE09DRAFT_1209785 [Coniochaeta sp. 2T2.1]